MMTGQQQTSVPPGFRFHPTEEELVYYYLRKKVSYEPIDLDVIRDIDLNKLEPWDLKEKCRIGSGPQDDWYFFSHKDKKYPTGTRTNRATMAGFWKATGRDKAIHLSCSRRIGMRKTLVFYTGRAPHGQKTEWIMHEYRLDDENAAEIQQQQQQQEDGWVICRVFKKKNHTRSGFHVPEIGQEDPLVVVPFNNAAAAAASNGCTFESPKQNPDHQSHYNNYTTFNNHHHHMNSMHLPQLMSPESTQLPSSYLLSSLPLMTHVIDPQNFLRLTSDAPGTSATGIMLPEKFSGDWLFLDKLLATHPTSVDQMGKFHGQFSDSGVQRSPFPYHHAFEPDFSKYSK